MSPLNHTYSGSALLVNFFFLTGHPVVALTPEGNTTHLLALEPFLTHSSTDGNGTSRARGNASDGQDFEPHTVFSTQRVSLTSIKTVLSGSVGGSARADQATSETENQTRGNPESIQLFTVTIIGDKKSGTEKREVESGDISQYFERNVTYSSHLTSHVLISDRFKHNMSVSDALPVGSNESINMSAQHSDRLSSQISCNQRCDDGLNYPCSCGEKCVLYKTCCEDFVTTCPKLYKSALAKYEHLLSLSILCDQNLVVFMVDSCPPNYPLKNEPLSESVDTSKNGSRYNSHGQTMRKNETIKAYSMYTILSEAPVTDLSTGIIFANMSIYNCNKRALSLLSGQTLRKGSATWKTQAATFANKYPDTMNNVQRQIDLSTYSYVPPTTRSTSPGSLCYNEWTRSCISRLSEVMGYQRPTCNMSVSEYYRLRNDLLAVSFKQVPQNICAWCLSRYQKLSERGQFFFLTGFRVLMSLSEIPGQVEISVPDEERTTRNPVPWWSWACRMSGQGGPAEGDTPCRALQCDPRYLISPLGLCKRSVEAEISIQADVFFKGQACSIDLEAFSRAAKCYLREFYTLKSTNKPFRLYPIYKARWSVTMIVLRMEMYFETERFEHHFHNMTADYFTFFTAMLVFAQHYCSMNEYQEGRNKSMVSREGPLPLSHQLFHSSPIKVTNKREDISSFGAKDSATENMMSYFIFDVCIKFNPAGGSVKESTPCDILEFKENKNRRTDDLLSRVKGLKCLKASSLQPSSKACKACVSFYALVLLIMLDSFDGCPN